MEAHCAFCGERDAEVEATGFDFEYDTCANEHVFVRCRRCDHRYLDPRPSREVLGDIYPSTYYAYADEGGGLVERVRRRWEGGKVRLYREMVDPGRRRILDVGCGDGRFLGLLRDFGSEDWALVGVDLDESAVKRCRDRGFEAHASRIETFAPSKGGFDAIVMLQLIEHVEDPRAIIERFHAILEPGGIVVIETPNTGGLDYRLFRGRWWGHYHFPRHWNLFSSESLERLLVDCGFEIERHDFMISTSAWTVSLHNLFLDRRYPEWFVRFFHYKNPLLLGLFVVVDSLRARLGYETSNQRVIARKPRREDGDSLP